MKFIFCISFLLLSCENLQKRNLSEALTKSCDLKKNDCPEKFICMNFSKDQIKCLPKPIESKIKNFILPFDSKTEVVCTHASGLGSHSYPNAFYALDLATPYNQPASKIYAAAEGKAFVFTGDDGNPCMNPKGKPSFSDTDSCGKGWGNHVKILHKDGYYSFYVHLEKIFIKNKQDVKQGDLLGLEGYTGLAGHRHLHWSVNKLPGSNQSEWEQKISWDGESVPFKFKAFVNGQFQIIDTEDFHCPHANIGEVVLQPRFKGIQE